jgi:hypothetical protein
MPGTQCEFIERTPIYIKEMRMPDGRVIQIDRSEWANENGAFFRYNEVQCQYVADTGKRYCPRHELELATKGEAA